HGALNSSALGLLCLTFCAPFGDRVLHRQCHGTASKFFFLCSQLCRIEVRACFCNDCFALLCCIGHVHASTNLRIASRLRRAHRATPNSAPNSTLGRLHLFETLRPQPHRRQ